MMARKHLKPELRKEPFVLAHLDCSSNLTLASQLTLHFRAESLKTTLLMTVLSKGMSTEDLMGMR